MQARVASRQNGLRVAVDKENTATAKRAQAPAERKALSSLMTNAKPAPKAPSTRPKRTRAKGIGVDENAPIEYAPPSKSLKEIPYRPPADLDFPLDEILRPRPSISILSDKELTIEPEFAPEPEPVALDLPVSDLDSLIPALPDVILPED